MIPTSESIGNAQVYIEGPAFDSVCYGNTVSLTCSYPNIMDMVNGINKYSTTRSDWAVNGTRILPDGMTTSVQTLSSTSERLDVTLTREKFEGSLFYYSCYLVLYNESRETSRDVKIDPPGEGVYLCDSVCFCQFLPSISMKTITLANMYDTYVCWRQCCPSVCT